MSLTDLQSVAADIKSTLSAAITDLRADIQTIAVWIGAVEQASTYHVDAIRQMEKASDINLSHILEIHRHLEDLNNQGRRHNINIRGVPENIEQPLLKQTAEGIFNDLLDRTPDSPIGMERIHRALRPRECENYRPGDIICCLVNFPL